MHKIGLCFLWNACKKRANSSLFSLAVFFGLSTGMSFAAYPSRIYAFHAPSVPIQGVKADTIEIQNKKICLIGSVVVTYDLGVVSCDKAIVYLSEVSKKEKGSGPSHADKIDLFGSVVIDMRDGSTLTADKGEIFCTEREAVFYGSPTEKVVYTSYCDEDGKKIPVKAKGKKITAKIVKDSSGKSSLSDIRGEGAVSIEYMRQDAVEEDKEA